METMKRNYTVTFKAGSLRSVHTMTGTRAEVKAWADRELAFFIAPSYLRKTFTITGATA